MGRALSSRRIAGRSRSWEPSVDIGYKTALCISPPYWGDSRPLAWRWWEQNIAQPAGHEWQPMRALFAGEGFWPPLCNTGPRKPDVGRRLVVGAGRRRVLDLVLRALVGAEVT